MKITIWATIFVVLLYLYTRLPIEKWVSKETVVEYSQVVNGRMAGAVESITIPVGGFDVVDVGDTTWLNVFFDKLPDEDGKVPKNPNNMVYEFSTAKGKGKDLAMTKEILVSRVIYPWPW